MKKNILLVAVLIIVLAALVALCRGVLWLRGVAAELDAGLQGPRFSLPARVYARPLVLRVGSDTVRVGLVDYLEIVGYEPVAGPALQTGQYSVADGRWTLDLRSFAHAGGREPARTVHFRVDDEARITELWSDGGGRIDSLILDPPRIGTIVGDDGEVRQRIELDALPDHVVDALLVTEDRRFYHHLGIDPIRIAGAARANLKAGRVVEGGSTLTQQFVKNYFLSPERTVERKIREAAMAVLLETRTTKQELLEAYMTEIYLGQNGGFAIHGYGSAAHHYFAKPVSELELHEAALLAGIIKAPSAYSPLRQPEAALARRNLVLALMRDAERIDAQQYAQAAARPLGVHPPRRANDEIAFFLDHLNAELRDDFTTRALERDGLTVYASVDVQLQKLAQRAVRAGVEKLEESHPRLAREGSPLQAALVALDPRSGEVLAMVGSRDYVTSPYNRAADARRQPGSTFKPIVALAAVAEGDGLGPRYTLASPVVDLPLTVVIPRGGGTWRPHNYDGRFRGPVTLRTAVEKSLNVPMARVGLAVGPERVAETARALGIESPLQPVPSIALGSNEVTLLDITRAYGVIANQGLRVASRAAISVVDRDGAPIGPQRSQPVQAFAPDETYLVISALQGVVARGTARSLPGRHGYTGTGVGKTGTTNGKKDAWFVGVTPELAVGVWVGFDDGASTGQTGSSAALPIWAEFVKGALGADGGSEFTAPSGVVEVQLASIGCPGGSEVMIAATVSHGACTEPMRVAKVEPKPEPQPVQVAQAAAEPVQVASANPAQRPLRAAQAAREGEPIAKPVEVAKVAPHPEPQAERVARSPARSEPAEQPVQVASANPAREARVAPPNRRSETPRAGGADARVQIAVKRRANSRLPQPTDEELLAIAAAVRNQALERIARADGFAPGGTDVRLAQAKPGALRR